MQPPKPADLLSRLRATPPGALLLEALAGVDGAHLVGGAIRDLLLGQDPVDLDVVVEGDALDAARTAADRLGGAAVTHERFGTATVSAPGLAFDLVTARSERYVAPGALPDVAPASLDADLARRDFTVNALAMALDGPAPGAVRGVPHALDDLDQRRLRVLHDASFSDDPTRLLRLVRYAARLRFGVEPHTHDLAVRAIHAGAPATVSRSRIGDELMLLLREPTAPEALERARALGLNRALHADLRFDQATAEAALSLLPPDGRRELLLLAMAARDMDPDVLRAWLDDLQLPAPERDIVVASVANAPRLAEELRAARAPSEIAAAVAPLPLEAAAAAGALGARDPARAWLDELRHVKLLIGGDDLVAAGVPQGPDVGRGLRAALAARLDGTLPGEREAELAAALAALGRK